MKSEFTISADANGDMRVSLHGTDVVIKAANVTDEKIEAAKYILVEAACPEGYSPLDQMIAIARRAANA